MHATIYLARKCEESLSAGEVQEPVCLKVFKPYEDAEAKENPENEYRVSQKLKGHENILQIKSFEQQKPIMINGKEELRDFLVMEYCENGDLFEFLSKYANLQ